MFVAAPARGAVVWTPANLFSAKELAASGALASVAIPTRLSSFRYPFLQADGSVIFIANDHLKPRSRDGRAGIFKIDPDGRVSSLTSVGEALANTSGKVDAVMGLKVSGGRAVFNVCLDNGDYGIALWENGVSTMLSCASGPGTLSDFGYPDISGDNVVFTAQPGNSGRSLYSVNLASANRAPSAIVPNGTPVPGINGLQFREFADSQFADENDVVFRAYSADFPIGAPVPEYAGAFRKSASGTEPIRKIVDTNTQIPGAAEGATFAHHLLSAIPHKGHTVIVNQTGNLQGIYLAHADGKIDLITDTNTFIPDLFEGPFVWFSKWVSNCHPWILFIAKARAYTGIFAFNSEDQVLYLLADSRMQFGGKTIMDAEISNAAIVGNKIALMLEFEDSSSSICLATFGKGLPLRKSGRETASAQP